MSDTNQAAPDIASPGGDALSRLSKALGGEKRGLPPVEKWNPPFCGDLDMRIAHDGTWFYMGTPIGRPALVKLFSTVLRKDPERYVLVTPVERVGIAVEDVPFMAVEMAVDGEGMARTLAFRTNVDDLVQVGPDHPMRFERDEGDGIRPYLLVRGELWARVTRALTYDIVDMMEERDTADGRMLGLGVADAFYPAVSAAELQTADSAA